MSNIRTQACDVVKICGKLCSMIDMLSDMTDGNITGIDHAKHVLSMIAHMMNDIKSNGDSRIYVATCNTIQNAFLCMVEQCPHIQFDASIAEWVYSQQGRDVIDYHICEVDAPSSSSHTNDDDEDDDDACIVVAKDDDDTSSTSDVWSSEDEKLHDMAMNKTTYPLLAMAPHKTNDIHIKTSSRGVTLRSVKGPFHSKYKNVWKDIEECRKNNDMKYHLLMDVPTMPTIILCEVKSASEVFFPSSKWISSDKIRRKLIVILGIVV